MFSHRLLTSYVPSILSVCIVYTTGFACTARISVCSRFLQLVQCEMSHWQSEECGASPDDRIVDRSKDWLSSEKREMLVHYFNHKAMIQRQEKQEVRGDSDAVTTGHHCYPSAVSHVHPKRLDGADNYQLVERCAIIFNGIVML